MVKLITTNDFLLIFPEIEKLYKQDISFKMNTALKLLKLYNASYDMNSYILNRIKAVLPKLSEENHILTDDEKLIYNTILSSMLEVDNQGLTKEELFEDNKALISVKGLEKILEIL